MIVSQVMSIFHFGIEMTVDCFRVMTIAKFRSMSIPNCVDLYGMRLVFYMCPNNLIMAEANLVVILVRTTGINGEFP